MLLRCLFMCSFLFTFFDHSLAALSVGISKTDITPPVGTPSAGYTVRNGKGMKGVHDSLLAIAAVIHTDNKTLIFCSVDHLGFSDEMVQKIKAAVREQPELAQAEIYIGSSHTHAGGGAYLNIPVIGESLAGPFDPALQQFYIAKTTEAILKAQQQLYPAKIGFGYGHAHLSQYRGTWPLNVQPLSDVAIIKITHEDGRPLAVLFNYALHPTVLSAENWLFSADFVGQAREHIKHIIDPSIEPIFF